MAWACWGLLVPGVAPAWASGRRVVAWASGRAWVWWVLELALLDGLVLALLVWVGRAEALVSWAGGRVVAWASGQSLPCCHHQQQQRRRRRPPPPPSPSQGGTTSSSSLL